MLKLLGFVAHFACRCCPHLSILLAAGTNVAGIHAVVACWSNAATSAAAATAVEAATMLVAGSLAPTSMSRQCDLCDCVATYCCCWSFCCMYCCNLSLRPSLLLFCLFIFIGYCGNYSSNVVTTTRAARMTTKAA